MDEYLSAEEEDCYYSSDQETFDGIANDEELVSSSSRRSTTQVLLIVPRFLSPKVNFDDFQSCILFVFRIMKTVVHWTIYSVLLCLKFRVLRILELDHTKSVDDCVLLIMKRIQVSLMLFTSNSGLVCKHLSTVFAGHHSGIASGSTGTLG